MKVFVLFVSIVIGRKPAIRIKDEQMGFKWDETNVSLIVISLLCQDFRIELD